MATLVWKRAKASSPVARTQPGPRKITSALRLVGPGSSTAVRSVGRRTMPVTVIVRGGSAGASNCPLPWENWSHESPATSSCDPGRRWCVRARSSLTSASSGGVVAGEPAVEDPWVLVQANPVVADPREQRLPALGAHER